MTRARILAIGGTVASLLVMLGGWLHIDALTGASGAVMLAANLAVATGAGRERAPRSPRAVAMISNCTTNGDLVCVARSDES